MTHLVPILDHGVTLDRGDHVIVLLDAAGGDDVQRQIDAICELVGTPTQDKPRPEET